MTREEAIKRWNAAKATKKAMVKKCKRYFLKSIKQEQVKNHSNLMFGNDRVELNTKPNAED